MNAFSSLERVRSNLQLSLQYFWTIFYLSIRTILCSLSRILLLAISLNLICVKVQLTSAHQEAAFVIVHKGRMSGGVIMYIEDLNSIQCMVSCMNNLACVSINHHHSEKFCELLNGKYDKEKMNFDAPGWKHYDTPTPGR